METGSFSPKNIDAENITAILEQLKDERDRLQIELKQEYRKARRYVRAHPEEGLLIAFVGGLLAGVLISKLSD